MGCCAPIWKRQLIYNQFNSKEPPTVEEETGVVVPEAEAEIQEEINEDENG